MSVLALSLYLLLSNLGASVVEVANDAIVAEAGKQKNTELPSFVWMASSLGGILGNLLGGIAIKTVSSRSTFLVFGLLALLQFFVTVNIREKSLNLPVNPSGGGIKNHVSDLSRVLRKPEISYSIAWMALSTATVPVLTGTMFFYQTKILGIDASLVGVSKVVGQVAMLLWGVAYDRWLKTTSPRKLIAAVQGTMAVFVVSDLLFVRGVYRGMGVPDSVYVLFVSGVLESLFYFKNLPFTVLMTRVCPRGCEGSLMAFVMSAIALAFIVSGYLGIVLASFVEVTVDDYSGFGGGLAVEAICVVIPLVFTSWIYDEKEAEEKSKKKE